MFHVLQVYMLHRSCRTFTQCIFGIISVFVTLSTLIMTTFIYIRSFPVAFLTVPVVSASILRMYSLKFGSKLLITVSAFVYTFSML
ncbi:uncharacterized protein LOC122569066 isoform X4 [Bombus pyrosoma]|uniref:uncharacterized protein LOC122569066 isoform X4 n=1 Tax=Bombus pyrosoma TaxID=396416 RepID=UPI001CB8C9FB|nr:uncharacterized protein LOC122569066 isoform X4 [Bombus pyrosoma]